MPPLLLGGIIAAGGAIGSAAIQAHAASKATDAEVKANNNALNVAQQQYGQTQQMLQPFISGQNTAALQRPVTGAGGYTPGVGLTAPTVARSAAPNTFQPAAPQMGAPASQGGMVMLQAPTGETRRVPAGQAQMYIARGAKVIG